MLPYDMRARHYDPHLRQWTARDPLGYVDGFDVWGYVGGDPLNYADPFGTSRVESVNNPPGSQSGHTTSSDRGTWSGRGIGAAAASGKRSELKGLLAGDPVPTDDGWAARKARIEKRFNRKFPRNKRGGDGTLTSAAADLSEVSSAKDIDELGAKYPDIFTEQLLNPPDKLIIALGLSSYNGMDKFIDDRDAETHADLYPNPKDEADLANQLAEMLDNADEIHF